MGKATNGNKITPLEVEPLHENGGLEVTEDGAQDSSQAQFFNFNPLIYCYNGWLLLCAYIDYYRAVTIPIGAFGLIILVIYSLEAIAYHSTKAHVAVISHDYTDAHSVFELKMNKIDHWCLSGGDVDCRCEDPTVGATNEQTKGWVHAHNMNKRLFDTYLYLDDIDVVFLGDESTEEWNGRWLGSKKDELEGIAKYFNKTFTRDGGGDVEGLALGISGDTVANLLWRLQHGEMPDSLRPKVWWITIGVNDLDLGQCAEEPTLLGILRLAEFVAEAKPGSMVVINSLLPRDRKVKSLLKKDAFKPFDLFPSIKVVNDQLEKFCKKHSEFRFFDASSIFMDKPPPSKDKKEKEHQHSPPKPSLKEDRISSDGQVSLAGHKAWGKAVAAELKRIMYDEMYSYSGGDFFDDMFTDDFST